MGFVNKLLYSLLTTKTTREVSMLDEIQQLKKEVRKLNKLKDKNK